MLLTKFRKYILKSREKWFLQLLQQLPAHHGEKFINQEGPICSNQDMVKLEPYEVESASLVCVNPHIISPPADQKYPRNQVESVSTPPNSCQQDSLSAARRSEAESSGAFYKPNTPILSLDMEIFADLTGYCQSKMSTANLCSNAVDELNTPVFDKDMPFDFGKHLQHGLMNIINPTEPCYNFMIKTEQSDQQTVNNNSCNEDSVVFNEGVSRDCVNYMPNMDGNTIKNSVVYNQNINTNISIPFSPESDSGENFNHNNKLTPVFINEKSAEDEEIFATVNNYSDIFYNCNQTDFNDNSNSQGTSTSSLRTQYYKLENVSYITPEESINGSDISGRNSPILKLDINKAAKAICILNTPDVIAELSTIETEKEFNILNLVSEEEITASATVFSSLSSAPLTTIRITPEEFISQLSSKVSVGKCPRRKRKDEDDEDYIPPTKRKPIGRKSIKIAVKPSPCTSSDSEDDEPAPARRGRPPKRNVSVSSEEYLETDSVKYRELRNKNNEASRKSRLKRKVKEMSYEQQADELSMRNTKLKVQVEDLERTVTTFRTNLMAILLKK